MNVLSLMNGKRIFMFLGLLLAVYFSWPFAAAAQCTLALRADANRDGEVNIADPVAIMLQLFVQADPSRCLEAMDANHDKAFDLTDAVYVLNYLFRSGTPPPEPFPQKELMDCSRVGFVPLQSEADLKAIWSSPPSSETIINYSLCQDIQMTGPIVISDTACEECDDACLDQDKTFEECEALCADKCLNIPELNGEFSGNNHQIIDLQVAAGEDVGVGLFGAASQRSKITNLQMINPVISGSYWVGSLAGRNSGRIEGCQVKSSAGGMFSLSGHQDIGGVVGESSATAVIDNVVVDGNGRIQGVPLNDGADSENSARIGGLAGSSNGMISNSVVRAGVVVDAGEKLRGVEDLPKSIGGLAGEVRDLTGNVLNSHSSAQVQGFEEVGGLVGILSNWAVVERSSAQGNVTGQQSVGGLVGLAEQNVVIRQSRAQGQVTGTGNRDDSLAAAVGGLIGVNQSFVRVEDCRAEGKVTGGTTANDRNYIAGGLIGINWNLALFGGLPPSVIKRSYSTGPVELKGGGNKKKSGGLVGENSQVSSFDNKEYSSTIANSVYNMTVNPQIADPRGEGRSEVQLKTISTFSNLAWDISFSDEGQVTVWKIRRDASEPARLNWEF